MATPEEVLPILQVRNLATGYGDLRVVWDVSLDVSPGRITALLGRNGAGKTTTLRAITGLNKVAGGTVTLDGADIAGVPAHRRVRQGIAFVQEGKRVFHAQTIEQNLLLGGYARRLRRSLVHRELDVIYDLFPILGEKRNLKAGSMSGGQQQMLAIGQALMAQPRVLLLDEPSGGLAPVIVREVMSRIGELRSTGLAILLVEQSVEAMAQVADDLVVLDMGRVVLSSPAGEATDLDRVREAYLGRSEHRPPE